MRFDDIMRYVPVNEDWENSPDEVRRKNYEKWRERGLQSNRDYKQGKFEMDRQVGIGGDYGDISRYHNYPNERDFREKNIKTVSGSKRMLRDVFEKHLLPAKDVLFNYYSAMEELQKEGFNSDMSGTGRAIGVELRRLVPAVKDAYDAIARIGRMV